MRKIGFGIVGLVALLVALAFVFQAQIGAWLFQRTADQLVGRNNLPTLSDGLHVGLCGTGSPMPNVARAGPCNFVIAGDQFFVVDIGEGGNRNINVMREAVAETLRMGQRSRYESLFKRMAYLREQGASREEWLAEELPSEAAASARPFRNVCAN